MALRIYRHDEPEALFICGVGCERITGPFSWDNADISLVIGTYNETPDRVIDTKAGFELQCHGIVVLVGPSTDFEKTFDNFLGENPPA